MLKETYLDRLRLKHPDNFNKYDYSLLPNEFYNREKIKIKCIYHNHVFEQRFDRHLQNRGCPICGRERSSKPSGFKLSLDTIIDSFRKIHGDKYDYSKAVYRKKRSKIDIVCKKHNYTFSQFINSHLDGYGCPKCVENKCEVYIYEILNKYNINFIRDYILDDYSYDFYLPEYDIYIDYISQSNLFENEIRNKKDIFNQSNGLLILLNYKLITITKVESELLRLFTILHPDFFINKDLVKEYINQSKLYLIEDGICFKRKL